MANILQPNKSKVSAAVLIIFVFNTADIHVTRSR